MLANHHLQVLMNIPFVSFKLPNESQPNAIDKSDSPDVILILIVPSPPAATTSQMTYVRE